MRLIILCGLLLFVSHLTAQPDHHILESRFKQTALQQLNRQTILTASQRGFDVHYYALNLEINPQQQTIAGHVQAGLRVTAALLEQIDYHFSNSGMTVDSVTVNGVPVDFTHQQDMLSLYPAQAASSGELLNTRVYYHGTPASSGLGSFTFSSYRNKPMVYSLSEPYGARTWWPCKDVNTDKADSVDLRITVPSGMLVASNGLLKSEQSTALTSTYEWQERYPIATYLVSVATYAYRRYTDSYTSLDGTEMLLEYFVFPDHYDNADLRANYGRTKDMIAFFAGLFGEYPFVKEKYGHADFTYFGGGMEHQTCSSMGGYSIGLISHELAHQWWGDLITCADFHHIWLNEGFATYCEALWLEHDQGIQAYHNDMAANAYKGGGTIYVQDTTNVYAIFNSGLSYKKASYVLHMLRHVVGDTVFFDILRAYYNDPDFRYGTADTEDFQAVCEAVSGRKLDYFFQQWIYGEYYPSYQYDWDYSNGAVQLNIRQVQTNTGLFKMPLDVLLHMPSGDTLRTVVWDSLAVQSFHIACDTQPLNVDIDPDHWVLRDLEQNISNLPEPATTSAQPCAFELTGIAPNPFNSQTRLQLRIQNTTQLDISIYDVLGKKVTTLRRQEIFGPGIHQVVWAAGDLPSGTYYVRISDGNTRLEQKLLLLK